MSQPEQYDVVVMGSGTGGKLMAWSQAKAGRRTIAVERRYVGGSCPNVNCLPSKNEVWTAKVVDLVRHADEFGMVTGPVVLDMGRVRQRKRDMVDGLVAVHLEKFRASGAELLMGEGHFVAPKTLSVRTNDGGTRLLTGRQMFLNLGTHATIPSIPGLAEVKPMTNIELLEIDRLPEHLVVLGGGYVGVEFAQIYRRFGSRVTVLERGSHLLSQEDPDVSSEIEHSLEADDVEVLLEAQVLRVEGRSGASVRLQVRTPGGDREITGSDVLVAAGRTPSTAGLGLDVAGVEFDARGYIRVNDRLETTAPDVWAIGESAGSPQFTHVSENDFRVIWDNLAGGSSSTRDRLVPFCVFTDPPFARVGLTESEARRQGRAVRVARIPMDHVLRTWALGEKAGFMKVLVEGTGDHILGFAMIGPEAGEVMAVVQTAMLGGLPYRVLGDAILTHPTMAEGLIELFDSVPAAVAREARGREVTGEARL